jgi:hypothetical protein
LFAYAGRAAVRAELDTLQVPVVALDSPTSWQLATPGDEFTARMFTALNAIMLDIARGGCSQGL